MVDNQQVTSCKEWPFDNPGDVATEAVSSSQVSSTSQTTWTFKIGLTSQISWTSQTSWNTQTSWTSQIWTSQMEWTHQSTWMYQTTWRTFKRGLGGLKPRRSRCSRRSSHSWRPSHPPTLKSTNCQDKNATFIGALIFSFENKPVGYPTATSRILRLSRALQDPIGFSKFLPNFSLIKTLQ